MHILSSPNGCQKTLSICLSSYKISILVFCLSVLLINDVEKRWELPPCLYQAQLVKQHTTLGQVLLLPASNGFSLLLYNRQYCTYVLPDSLADSGNVQSHSKYTHRVDIVLGFFSSRPNWDPPNSSTAGECVTPSLFRGGGGTLACGRGGGGVQIRTMGQKLFPSPQRQNSISTPHRPAK